MFCCCYIDYTLVSYLSILVGGALGIAYASAVLQGQLSQELQDRLIPEGNTPIAAFLTNSTRTDPRINSTSATFAETAGDSGSKFYMF